MQELRGTDAAKELARADGFGDFKEKYPGLTENSYPPIDFYPKCGIIKVISIDDISTGSFKPIAGRVDGRSLRDLTGEVSKLAQKDGLEYIVACCVKLSHGETIPAELKEIYHKYMSGGG